MNVAKDHFYVTIGRTIRAARESRNMSQKTLAMRAKLSVSTIDKAETDNCSLFVLAHIAEALDVTLDELCPIAAMMPPKGAAE